MKPKKKPGKNIPNAQRHTVQILLRLPPDVAERLDELAEEWGITRAGVVGRLVERHEDPEEDFYEASMRAFSKTRVRPR